MEKKHILSRVQSYSTWQGVVCKICQQNLPQKLLINYKGMTCNNKLDIYIFETKIVFAVCLFVYLSVYLNLSIHLSIYLPIYLSIHLSIFFLRNTKILFKWKGSDPISDL